VGNFVATSGEKPMAIDNRAVRKEIHFGAPLFLTPLLIDGETATRAV
jgi:hypothetical protein